MMYEKDRPTAQLSDETRKRRLTYYFSDVGSFPLRGSGDMKTEDGESVSADIQIDDKVLTVEELSQLEKISAKVWKALVASKGYAAKP